MTDLDPRSDLAPDAGAVPDSAGQADVEAGLVRRLSIVSLLPLVAVTLTTALTSPWYAECHGTSFGSWHRGSPLPAP